MIHGWEPIDCALLRRCSLRPAPVFCFPSRVFTSDPETLTGLQLLLGPRLGDKTIEPDPLATISALCAMIAFFLSLFPGTKNLACSALVAIPGAASLIFLMRSSEAQFEPACYMMLFLFTAATLYGLVATMASAPA